MEKNAGNVQTSRLEGTTRDLVGLGVTASWRLLAEFDVEGMYQRIEVQQRGGDYSDGAWWSS